VLPAIVAPNQLLADPSSSRLHCGLSFCGANAGCCSSSLASPRPLGPSITLHVAMNVKAFMPPRILVIAALLPDAWETRFRRERPRGHSRGLAWADASSPRACTSNGIRSMYIIQRAQHAGGAAVGARSAAPSITRRRITAPGEAGDGTSNSSTGLTRRSSACRLGDCSLEPTPAADQFRPGVS
jgi:hypothetical protein